MGRCHVRPLGLASQPGFQQAACSLDINVYLCLNWYLCFLLFASVYSGKVKVQ